MTQSQRSDGWSRQGARFHFRRLSINALFQISSQVLPLFAGAIAIPLLYREIGRDEFGVFTIGLSALGLFSLLDLGLGRAAVRFMARAFGQNDSSAAASIAVHSVVLLGGFSAVVTIACVAMIPTAAARWFHNDLQDPTVLRQCLYILVAALPIAGLTSVFRAILEARENFLVISIVQVLLGVLTYLVPLIISFFTSDVRFIIGGAVACRLIAFVAFLVAATVAWPGRFDWRNAKLSNLKEFRQFSLWMVISNMVGSAIVYGDRALLVKMFGIAEIPYYNIPLEMLGRFMILVNSAATVVFPSLSKASENKVLFNEVYVSLSNLLSVLVGAALLVVSLLTPVALHVWLGDDFRNHSTLIVRVLLVGVSFQTLNVFALATLNARGFARPITYMHLLETPAYFWALYTFGRKFGLVGVAAVWSARLTIEYICFSGFQAWMGAKGARLNRISGAFVAATNSVPLMLVLVFDNILLAFAGIGLSVVLTYAWTKSFVRKARQQPVQV